MEVLTMPMLSHYDADRLILRLSCGELAESVVSYLLRNRDFLEPFEPARPEVFYTVEFQREELEKSAEASERGSEYRYWLCPRAKPDIVIGMVGASGIIMGAFRSCFLSYKLDKDFLRQGLAAEAVDRFVNALFTDLRLHRVEANIMPRNIASLSVTKKLGFANEGLSPKYLKINGIWEDHIHMVKLNTLTEV